MKKLILISTFLILGLTANAETSTNYYHRVGGYFYTNLTPYGTWIEIGNGVIAWRPTILVRNWAPYKLGRWIWTDYGWYWDSYEPFGHIVFHYGRWYFDDYYGWIWIPDYDWAPAWVEWRYDDDYIGWAPLHPYAVFSIDFGIRITYEYYVPYTHWHFVTYKHFCNPYVYNYYIPEKHKYRVYGRTKYRNAYRYYNGRVRNEGVDFDIIRKRSGQKIVKRDLITSNDPREFENTRRRDEDRIRTFIADRNEIERDRDALRDVKIERTERKLNIEMDRVELAEVKRSRTNDRNEVRERQTMEKDRNVQREEKERVRIETEQREMEKRNDTRQLEEKKRTDEMNRTRTNDSRNFEKRKETENNNRIEREREIRTERNESNQNNRSFEFRRNDNSVEQKRNEVKRNEQIEKRNNIENNRNETRTPEINRNDNQRKVETNRNQTQQQNNNSERSRNNNTSERTR